MLATNVATLKLKKNPKPKLKKNNLVLGLAKVLVLSLAGLQLAHADRLKLKLAPGQKEFSFSLASNPTTGYRWTIQDYDASKLRFSGTKYHARVTGMMGSGGQQTFHFRVLKPHHRIETKIDLVYSRPWEKKAVKMQEVDVKTAAPHFFNLFKW
jgi:inhibitor of cysteine peptidase